MSATQQVITIDHISEESAPVIYVQNGLKPFMQMIRDEVCGEVPDLTTRKGRERIASLSATVSKRKASVEKPGRDYLRRMKEASKVVEVELREFVDEANALRDEIRKPLTDWEAADVTRRDKHTDGIQRIKDLAVFGDQPTAVHIAQVIADLELVALDDGWEEFLPEAAQAKDQALISLRGQLAQRQVEEAQQAELAQLRADAEARAEQDRIRLVQEAAVEHERQRVAQEQQAERDAAAKREQALKDQAAAQERAAENQRLQLQLQAEQSERAAAQAKADKIAAEQRAEQNRIDAEARQAKAVEQARFDELARQKAAADEILRQEKVREADKAHRIKIMGAAKEALIGMNISEELAKAIVLKIARREVPNVTINF